MRSISILLLSSLTFTACGEKDTEETTDTGTTEDTAMTEDTGDTEETDTEETDTEETDTEETDDTDTDTDTDTDDTDTDTDDTDTEEPDPLDVDDDFDGFTENDGDCDDADASFNPDAPDDENDGLDQNCDGTPDDGYVPSNGAVTVDMLVPGDLVITEVMQNPASVDDADGEWFEIVNNTNAEIDLDGLMVTDEPGGNQDSFTVTGEMLVPAGGYVVFAINADSTLNGGVVVDYEYVDMSLGNGSDELMLHNATDILDQIAWDNGSTFPDPTGAAMSLDPSAMNATDNDDGANWCEATSVYSVDLGTPGAMNDACPPPATVTSYAADVAPLLNSCMGCHGGEFMSSYTALMAAQAGDYRGMNASANMPLIDPGSPSTSYFLHKLEGTQSAGGSMPTGGSLPSSSVSMVEQWILDGANP